MFSSRTIWLLETFVRIYSRRWRFKIRLDVENDSFEVVELDPMLTNVDKPSPSAENSTV